VPAGELGAGVNGAVYEAPALTVMGTVGELTFDINKKFGDSDGYTFMGAPIMNASA
jgi:hypothetical protein